MITAAGDQDAVDQCGDLTDDLPGGAGEFVIAFVSGDMYNC